MFFYFSELNYKDSKIKDKMEKNVLKMERDSIAPFQKELYNGTKENPDIGTRFSLGIEKRSQASHMKIKLDKLAIGEEEGFRKVTYRASKKFDHLFKLSAHIPLFPIKVKEKWKKTISICYNHNPGHNIFVFGECKVDDEHLESIDKVWLDVHSQYFVEKKELYNQMVGNVDCLEEWGTELPRYPLIVEQPFSFTRKTQVSLPILKSSGNSITFEYTLRTKLTDLINMRVFHEGEYKEIKCNLKYLEYKSEEIPIPELWGRYGEVKDEERNWRKSINEMTMEPEKQIIYIEDVVMTNSKNPKPIGTTDVIPLESLDPAKYIFWVASLEGGKLSNYTTNQENVYRGWNPCAKSCITYGISKRVELLSHEHFDLAECYDFDWPNYPKEAGYNVHNFTFNPIDISHSDTAVILKQCGASLNVTLGETNPFLKDEEDEDDQYDENGDPIPTEAIKNIKDDSNRDKYIVHVRTVVTKKLEVYWSDKENKLKYNFV